jgi:hypothetical protein
MLRPLFALLILGLCVAAPARGRVVEVTARPVALDPTDASERHVGELEYLGGFELDSPDPAFGGYSGALVAGDGGRLLAVSDLGDWLELSLRHDRRGRLVEVSGSRLGPLRGPDGGSLHLRISGNAEAIVSEPDGAHLVAFEGRHRILRYPPGDALDGAVPQAVAVPGTVTRLPANEGIEGLVSLGRGTLLLIAETGGESTGIPAWLRLGGNWHALWLARTDSFAATDATVLPTGDVLLLERRFTLLGGPAARLSLIAATQIRPGAVLRGRELARLALPFTVDNFEAVAARAAPDGSTLIYVMSDDNRNRLLQRTLLLQFRCITCGHPRA